MSQVLLIALTKVGHTIFIPILWMRKLRCWEDLATQPELRITDSRVSLLIMCSAALCGAELRIWPRFRIPRHNGNCSRDGTQPLVLEVLEGCPPHRIREGDHMRELTPKASWQQSQQYAPPPTPTTFLLIRHHGEQVN